MLDTLEGAWSDRRAGGWARAVGFALRASLDLVVSGMRHRFAPSRGTPVKSPLEARRASRLVSWLDVKLGVRMLGKHPGLTLVSTFALAVGIPVGLGPDHFVDGILAPLPVPEGHRIRALRLWSPALGRAEGITHLDFEVWRDGLGSFQELAAFRETRHNVDAASGVGGAVRGAEVTASTFTLLRVLPLLGRALQPADERPGGEAVVVIGHDLWQARYAGDPAVVGRSIRLGNAPHTVVGVMPEGFNFPERQDLWIPLRLPATAHPDDAIPVTVFGRLAPGATDAQARAEFSSVAQRSAPTGRDPLAVPQVEAFAYTLLPGLGTGLRATREFMAFRALALVVLLVACANVGMLVFARTATRAGELAVRTALGAGRVRIVTQIFVECLVLALFAAGVGLFVLMGVVQVVWWVMPAGVATALPYWIDWGLRADLVVRSVGLAAVCAVAAGVVPAMRLTGRSVQATLQRTRAARAGVRFGGVAGILIVADVAVAVAAVGFATTAMDVVEEARSAHERVGIAAEEYLAASITVPAPEVDASGSGGTTEWTVRTASLQQELVRRLEAEPEVRAVAVAEALPRMQHRTSRVEAEGMDLPDGREGVSVRVARVDLNYFDALGRPILSGRGFDAADLAGDRPTVIVNKTFVERVLGGQNPLGRRIRFHPWGDGEAGPWKEIVGVVDHLGMRIVSAENDQGVYEPLAPGDLSTVRLGIHVGADPASFAPRLRGLAGEVDPEAVVSIIGPLDTVYEGDWYVLLAAGAGAGLLVAVLLALAASGIYAIMSHSVAERTTEIGIRAALGASRSELVRSVARRAVLQLALGVGLGIPVAAVFLRTVDGSPLWDVAGAFGMGLAVLAAVGVAACTGPTLRALQIHPSEALRGDG